MAMIAFTESSREHLPTPLFYFTPLHPILDLAAMLKASYFHISQTPKDPGPMGLVHDVPICDG